MMNGSDMRGNLTQMQHLIWMGQALNPSAPLYNMALAFDFEGRFDAARFQAAFEQVVAATDALRTVVDVMDDLPQQRVLPHIAAPVELIDFSTDADPQARYAAWLEQRRLRVFDLTQRLFDCALVKLGAERHVWYLNQHHLITDGWSCLVVYQRVKQAYEAAGAADVSAWPQYAGYRAHETAARSAPQLAAAQAHWATVLQTPSEPTPFFDRAPGSRDVGSVRVPLALGQARTAQLRALAMQPPFRALSADLALHNLLATLLLAWLRRVGNRDTLRIGLPFHNRPSAAFKNTAGVFIEICPLTVPFAADTFVSLHSKVAGDMLRSLRHAVPGVSSAQINGSYDVLLNFVNVAFPPLDGLQPAVTWVHPDSADREHALRLQVHDFGATGSYTLLFDFNVTAFTPQQRDWAAQQFLQVVDAFLADPQQPIDAVSLQTSAERELLVRRYNASAAPYPAERTVLDLFRERAALHPDDAAVAREGQVWSYAALNRASDTIARQLLARGVTAGQPVLVHMAHGCEVVAAVLGALKAGAAFVPVDPSTPAERLRQIVADVAAGSARPPLVLADPELASRLDGANADVLVIDEAVATAPGADAPLPNAAPDDLAYIIYTSGSTGAPKGVMLTHRNLMNYIWWAAREYTGGERLTFALFTSLSFDLTITTLFAPLITGGRIEAYREAPGAQGMAVLRVVSDNRCDVVKLTPSHLSLIKDLPLTRSRIRTFIVGGEDFKTELARAIVSAFGRPVALCNEYGPTEATVGCMIHRFDPARDNAPSVPIGVPAANAQVFVLDAHGNPAPTGVIGEMYLAGDGLARGYFNRPDLTAERFVPAPAALHDVLPPGARLYKTGDLARWRADGAIEFLGRADHQVKVNGARVELGDLEAQLLAHPDVRECLVDMVEPEAYVEPETHCTRCGLASNFPGVSYDDAGVCNFCRSYDSYKDKAAQYFKPMDELLALVDAIKARRTAATVHDCIVLLSGGKDSTYMLGRLVSMGLKPLAFTLDNGYISEQAKANIRRVVNHLGVDHVFGSTPAMNAIFVDSLRQFANVCNGCFKTIYTLAVNLARERGVRYVVTGLSRGQFFETRLTPELFAMPDVDAARIDAAILEARKAYHRRDDIISRSLEVDAFRSDDVFQDVEFIDFYRYCDVDLAEMYRFLASAVPWIRPSDTGRSTNCLINDAGIYVHKKLRRHHNYALPYSWDVRLGAKTREQAMDELDDEIDEPRVKQILRDIGYGDVDAHSARMLVAYYVADAPVSHGELREHLLRTLPEFMIPARFVWLTRMPLTPNGKIDRKALPRPDAQRPELAASYVAPRTAAEETLAAIWRDVLKLDKVGVHDNFFELGGDSLRNIQIVGRASQAGLRLTPDQLFKHQTIAELAGLAGDAAPVQAPAVVMAPSSGVAPAAGVSAQDLADIMAEFAEDE